ncbi:FAD-binding and (Fe-S)-binding domain-containing protein [Halorientalis regularis]|uniref:D-lactate dehydrogenase (cytochrome) n=1 Tax=Halorientalis regularis TaxID=660518 RepID=A0A1G7PLH4_9EURY|nr:FAD-binding and (Fe-S)-binding domain-containing protein [Halorientalis regularis]SDF86994.1 FAD/FMN-containing dehydrogenase [Halorientalis regularis]
MSSESGASGPSSDDPSTDERAAYDYQGGDVARPGLVADLRSLIDGEVRFDEYSREQYATDASIYAVTPVGVVFPTSTADVAAIVEYCADRGIPVLPRGAGTSLAGQTVNRAVVLDFSKHMDAIREIDADGRRARAQPGITLGHLNAALADNGLKFAPDPAWGDKSVLGGAIGNNSTGAHSLQYGKTDAYVEACEVVLADGTVTTFEPVPIDELNELADPEGDLEARIYAAVRDVLDDETIADAYPDLKRNVSGYNLDWLIERAREDDVVDVPGLLAGSEGTLAVVTEAEISLEPVPETKALALLRYDDLLDAMEDVAPILDHDPAAVEVLDDVLLDLSRDTAEFGTLVDEMVPLGTGAVLLVEFYADDDAGGRERVADLLADRAPGTEALAAPTGDGVRTDAPIRAESADEAHDEAEREQFWKLRKSGLPILLGRTSDAKHVAFVEDTAVPPENLPEFVADFRAVLDEHDTYASFYAHAGPGVLHIRPLVDTKTEAGVAQMEAIADDVTDLVVEYGGSVSGEHGDGRARTQWNRKLYGDAVWETFRDLKTAFDPDWLLNPGQVVSRPDDQTDMTEHLRFDPDYEFDAGFEPELQWDNENGLQGMAELCHGCGGCRGHQDTTGDVMCPTFRAAEEESLSTRGRANSLRRAMSGELPEDEQFSEEFVTEVLDLCIGCKGCAHDCPSEVDMAKLKAELTHEHHQREGASLRDRLFANVDTLSAVGSALAPLSNLATKVPGARTVIEKTAGIARERTLPTFRRRTFAKWFRTRGSRVPADDADRRVLLLPDTYTNYSRPEAGKAAVRVLEAAGVHVEVPASLTDSGRAAFSKGFLDKARETARTNVAELAPRVAEGWDVVVVEPSDAVMYQSDYLDLLGDTDDAAAAETVAENAYGVLEYLDTHRLDEGIEFDAPDGHLTYHGHCHQKATAKDHHAVGVLRRAGYRVDPLDSGCCGMAGSFGYEAEHYSMSRAIGDILFEQVEDSDGERVVAPGASCRTQLGDRPDADAEPPHPIESVADALAE